MIVKKTWPLHLDWLHILLIPLVLISGTFGQSSHTGNDAITIPCMSSNGLQGFMALLAEFALVGQLGKLDASTLHTLQSLNVSALEKVALRDQSIQDVSDQYARRFADFQIEASDDNRKLQKWKTCRTLSKFKPVFEKEPQTWQTVESRKVMVFSAFYESRELANGLSVRIIASGFQAAYNDIGTLLCQLWYEELDAPVISSTIYKVIYPSTGHHDSWCSHFIICRLPPEVISLPVAVSIVPTPCAKSENNLMVVNRKPVKKKGHGLCISPLYGKWRNWTMIAEWFEIHRLLGAEGMTIYNISVSSETNFVLRHYINRKSATVINWDFPPVKCNVFCQRGALNDCLYRMSHVYHYVTVTDLDEILVPRVVLTWPALLSRIGRPEVGVYMFQHLYFRRNETEAGEISLITQTSFWRTQDVTPPGKIRCKSMYRADQVISIDLHCHYQLLLGSQEYMLSPEERVLHHYRNTPMQSFRNPTDPAKKNFVEDRHMEKYGEQLKKAVNSRVEATQNDIDSHHSREKTTRV